MVPLDQQVLREQHRDRNHGLPDPSSSTSAHMSAPGLKNSENNVHALALQTAQLELQLALSVQRSSCFSIWAARQHRRLPSVWRRLLTQQ